VDIGAEIFGGEGNEDTAELGLEVKLMWRGTGMPMSMP